MDGDEFSKAPRLARAVVAAVLEAVGGAAFEPFHLARLLEHVVEESQGVSSLGVVLAIIKDLSSMPLLISARTEDACELIAAASRAPDGGMLDLVLAKVAQSEILRRETNITVIVENFVRELVERFVIAGRGGLIDTDGIRHVQSARALMAPIVHEAAVELVRRPDAIRLGISRPFRVTAESNLLGCTL